ncbi:late competence development ComFB family protein [Spirochaetia bacterium 38H-sp]|uniref:Late competence development ComFB family protein n=1 Tax=Rarispira pelagica TaxID=3141764 RepID=A0ABU9UBZ3_9SPIR
MEFLKEYDFSSLANESERLVLDELEKQLKALGDERLMSEECVLDIAAYALNHVKPRYRATLLGRIYASSISEEEAYEIKKAVTTAIKKVLADL